MSAAGYPSISLMLLTNLTTEHGVEFALPPSVQDQLTVPWPLALTVMEQLHDAMDDATREAVVREFVTSHPLIRTVAPLTAGVNAWLRVLWTLSKGVTTPDAFSYEQTEHFHELRISMEEFGPGHGYLQFTRMAAKYAPLAVGVAPLKELECECTPMGVRARFEAPVDLSSADRNQRASGIPLGTILTTLELLGPLAADAIRDGTLVFPGRQQALDEVARLSTDWKLTPTEARVTLALAEGRSPKQIADELDVAVGTVRVHLKHAYAKTETAGQRELADRVKAWRLG